MTGTKTKAARYEMLTNVPVTVDIKYVDVWPDNGYGSQVSVKGTIDGETQTVYLKGKAWANLKALAEAGVIAGYEKSDEEPTEKVNLPVVNGNGVLLCRRQLAGERFPTLLVETQGSTQGTPSRSMGTPSMPSRQTKQPIEFGAPIPGLDDDDMPPPVEEAYDARAASGNGAKLDAIFKLYDTCFDHAVALAQRNKVPEHTAAMAATIFIAAKDRGIVL